MRSAFLVVPRDLQVIADFVGERYGEVGPNVSSAPGARSVVFSPSVFSVPDGGTEDDLMSVMTSFGPAFEPVFASIRAACADCGLRNLRAKDFWQHSTVIQDVFTLIY